MGSDYNKICKKDFTKNQSRLQIYLIAAAILDRDVFLFVCLFVFVCARSLINIQSEGVAWGFIVIRWPFPAFWLLLRAWCFFRTLFCIQSHRSLTIWLCLLVQVGPNYTQLIAAPRIPPLNSKLETPQLSLAIATYRGVMQHVTWTKLDSWPSNHHIAAIGYSPCLFQCVVFVWVTKLCDLRSALGLVSNFVNPTSVRVDLMLMRADCTVFSANAAPPFTDRSTGHQQLNDIWRALKRADIPATNVLCYFNQVDAVPKLKTGWLIYLFYYEKSYPRYTIHYNQQTWSKINVTRITRV